MSIGNINISGLRSAYSRGPGWDNLLANNMAFDQLAEGIKDYTEAANAVRARRDKNILAEALLATDGSAGAVNSAYQSHIAGNNAARPDGLFGGLLNALNPFGRYTGEAHDLDSVLGGLLTDSRLGNLQRERIRQQIDLADAADMRANAAAAHGMDMDIAGNKRADIMAEHRIVNDNANLGIRQNAQILSKKMANHNIQSDLNQFSEQKANNAHNRSMDLKQFSEQQKNSQSLRKSRRIDDIYKQAMTDNAKGDRSRDLSNLTAALNFVQKNLNDTIDPATGKVYPGQEQVRLDLYGKYQDLSTRYNNLLDQMYPTGNNTPDKSVTNPAPLATDDDPYGLYN